jgi:hypothetical protein
MAHIEEDIMISNIPAFAVHQDYQARHSDMLAAARQVLTIERLPDVPLHAEWQPYPGQKMRFYLGVRCAGKSWMMRNNALFKRLASAGRISQEYRKDSEPGGSPLSIPQNSL